MEKQKVFYSLSPYLILEKNVNYSSVVFLFSVMILTVSLRGSTIPINASEHNDVFQ